MFFKSPKGLQHLTCTYVVTEKTFLKFYTSVVTEKTFFEDSHVIEFLPKKKIKLKNFCKLVHGIGVKKLKTGSQRVLSSTEG